MLQVHHHCCVPVLHERGVGQPSCGCGSAQNYKITKLQSLMLQVHHHCCVPVLHERGGGQPSGRCGSAQNYKITKFNVAGPPSLLCSCFAWTWWGATFRWLWLRSKLQNYKITKLQNYKRLMFAGPPSLLCSCSAWTWWGATFPWLWLRWKLQNYKITNVKCCRSTIIAVFLFCMIVVGATFRWLWLRSKLQNYKITNVKCCRSTIIAVFLFCMNVVGGNLPVVVAPLKIRLDDYRYIDIKKKFEKLFFYISEHLEEIEAGSRSRKKKTNYHHLTTDIHYINQPLLKAVLGIRMF